MASKAIVFAGQGAQQVGMGKDLAEKYPACKALFDAADDALGYALSTICFEGPDEELTKSNNCQPGIFLASMACYEALRAEVPGLTFNAAAGLSLGEWTALHMAGALTLADTLKALEARGRFMQEACESADGAMVSVIGLDDATLAEICAQAGGVGVANLNSRGQTVLSGTRAGVEQAEVLAREAGAKKTVVLNVAGAFHSELMRPAAERLAEVLADIPFKTPTIPVMSNATGKVHGEPDAIREAMLRQVTDTVRWYECIEGMRATGIESFVECGPGRVLSSLIRRIDREAACCNVQDMASLETAAAQLNDKA